MADIMLRLSHLNGSAFLRKEVIQPQVPLRLPCYDLVPIRSFIFGTNLVWRLRMPLPFVA